MKIENISIDKIIPYINNAKQHPDWQIKQIMGSIKEFGFNDPIAIDKDNVIIEGHGRLQAGLKLGLKEVPIIRLEHLTETQKKAYILAHNKLTMNTGFDEELLKLELESLEDIDWDVLGFNEEYFKIEDTTGSSGTVVTEKYRHEKERTGNMFNSFIVPPFSMLDGRAGYWWDRKKELLDMIGDFGQARADAKSYEAEHIYKSKTGGVSLLDPVLAEVILKWFAPNNAKVIDPFAGDTVFGYMAGFKGYEFTGIELRQEQTDFNNTKTKDFKNVNYICDDALNINKHIDDNSIDLLFSCPPYFNLEKYSDDPRDASNQDDISRFYNIIAEAFGKAIKKIKNNRFAVIVISDVRDEKGFYYNIPNFFIDVFIKNGMHLYNNIKLLTPLGTAPIRANNAMRNRKVVNIHQDVLVFYKGNISSNIKDDFKILAYSEKELYASKSRSLEQEQMDNID